VVLTVTLMLAVSQAQNVPRVFLNHAFVVPDAATYEAIANSRFMREEFGAFESRTTVRKDMTYTGLYWYGTSTYFEILQPSANDRSPSGIALGVEEKGGLKALVAGGVPGEIATVTRQAEGKDVNWFHMLMIAPNANQQPVELFAIEYEPDFLSNWYPQLPPTRPSIRRSDVLTRYAAKVGKSEQRERGLLQDVAAIHLKLAPEEARELLSLCGKIGYKVTHGSPATCIGADVTFTVDEETTSRQGITSVEFRLAREKTGDQKIQLGTSTLQFHGLSATWSF